jgi:hypothetical protein
MKTINVFPSTYNLSEMKEIVMSKLSKPPNGEPNNLSLIEKG